MNDCLSESTTMPKRDHEKSRIDLKSKERDNKHKKKPPPRYPDTEDEDDNDDEESVSDMSDQSTDSEGDYAPDTCTSFVDMNKLPEKLVGNAWVRQRGLCRISGMPMSGKTGLYSPVATVRVFGKGPCEDNIIIVCRVIYEMRQATTLPWKQFAQLIKVFGDQIGSDYRF